MVQSIDLSQISLVSQALVGVYVCTCMCRFRSVWIYHIFVQPPPALHAYSFAISKTGIMQDVTFLILTFSLSINPLRLIKLLCVSIVPSFLFAEYPMVWMYHRLMIHPLKDFFGLLPVSVFTNKTSTNIVYRFLCEHKYSFLWDKCPGMWSLGCMVSVYFLFKLSTYF